MDEQGDANIIEVCCCTFLKVPHPQVLRVADVKPCLWDVHNSSKVVDMTVMLLATKASGLKELQAAAEPLSRRALAFLQADMSILTAQLNLHAQELRALDPEAKKASVICSVIKGG